MQVSLDYPNAYNTFHYDVQIEGAEEALIAAITKAAKDNHGVLFVDGIYAHNKDTDDIEMEKTSLIAFIKTFKSTSLSECVTVYLLSRGKELKYKPTPEIMALSKLHAAKGVWDFDQMPSKTRIEAAIFGVVQEDGSYAIELSSMCFPFSNFGHKPINMKPSDFLEVEQIKAIMAIDDAQWQKVKIAMDINLVTVESLINGFAKMMASIFMPAHLNAVITSTFSSSTTFSLSEQAGCESLERFYLNNKRLESIEMGSAENKPFKATFHVDATICSFQGNGLHEKPVFLDNLEELVAIANTYIFWCIQQVLTSPPSLSIKVKDKAIKALGNSLHIHKEFFTAVNNGTTPYPLGKLGSDIGVNTQIQAAGILMRSITDGDFAAFVQNLLDVGVRIRESAAHWRGNHYYIDNTFGGSFGIQLGPYQEDLIHMSSTMPFYNAMGHGYALASKTILDPSLNLNKVVGQHITHAITRIIEASSRINAMSI